MTCTPCIIGAVKRFLIRQAYVEQQLATLTMYRDGNQDPQQEEFVSSRIRDLENNLEAVKATLDRYRQQLSPADWDGIVNLIRDNLSLPNHNPGQ